VTETSPGAVYAVLLAAGASRRFGGENKLLARIDGTSLVRRAAVELIKSRVAGVIAVTGFEADQVREALGGLDIQFAENREYADGLASSLRCGVAALPDDAAGVMIALADMPGMAGEHLNRLIIIFEEEQCGKIVYLDREDGSQGNPVIWPARYFAELQKLEGDTGARKLIQRYSENTRPLIVDADDVLDDIDTPRDLEVWQR
jgi:molybdenum cofactor cytidylyltransferase